jgi:hypothetical protein
MGFLEVLSCGCILQFVKFVGSSKDHFDVVAFCSIYCFIWELPVLGSPENEGQIDTLVINSSTHSLTRQFSKI